VETLGLIRRLCRSGILARLTIALVTLGEAGLLSWRIATAPERSRLVANSTQRWTDTLEILYRAERPSAEVGWTLSLTRAIDEPPQRQRSLNDLSGAQSAVYEDFVSSAREPALRPADLRRRAEVGRLGNTFSQVP
jgi:hypothetical protein